MVRALYARTGRAKVVGITGPPGAGKSTLVDRLARLIRKNGQTVGILGVAHTSPFTGGALLGDRIRMQALYTDPGVFIRSMATRGAMGGLAPATREAVDVLAAAGFAWVMVCARLRWLRLGAGRDRGGRTGRDRRRAQRRDGVGRDAAGTRRRHPGDQGGDHGDRRRVRDQQGLPRGRRAHGA